MFLFYVLGVVCDNATLRFRIRRAACIFALLGALARYLEVVCGDGIRPQANRRRGICYVPRKGVRCQGHRHGALSLLAWFVLVWPWRETGLMGFLGPLRAITAPGPARLRSRSGAGAEKLVGVLSPVRCKQVALQAPLCLQNPFIGFTVRATQTLSLNNDFTSVPPSPIRLCIVHSLDSDLSVRLTGN